MEGRYRSSLIDPKYCLRCQRYIELNPVRSGYESSPQSSTWTSFATHIGGKAESWLVNQQYFWKLGNTLLERQMSWANFVKEGAPHWEDRQITESLLQSKPWISDIYAKKLFKDIPEIAIIRQRGRPRKINPFNSIT